ncbi:hypothetical protein GDO78_007525 [Eleutherodactylus coqui]|uniref:Uncharacterized protein n=1 Tax=Eleutherodactylus coqui TaxID=57060 RepID=A0A8J6FI94_ELECQ|nr:hypothetical protein GDO78_007525 [Eleutherodactylus coqui]
MVMSSRKYRQDYVFIFTSSSICRLIRCCFQILNVSVVNGRPLRGNVKNVMRKYRYKSMLVENSGCWIIYEVRPTSGLYAGDPL